MVIGYFTIKDRNLLIFPAHVNKVHKHTWSVYFSTITRNFTYNTSQTSAPFYGITRIARSKIQILMYDLLSTVEHNTGILKNVGGQTTLNTIDLIYEMHETQKCSTEERNSYRFRITWGWVTAAHLIRVKVWIRWNRWKCQIRYIGLGTVGSTLSSYQPLNSASRTADLPCNRC